MVVLAISVHKPPPLMEDCHLLMVPECPERVSVPVLLPEQTVVLPLTVPPTALPPTVMIAAAELVGTHTPLNTTARYCLVAVRLV